MMITLINNALGLTAIPSGYEFIFYAAAVSLACIGVVTALNLMIGLVLSIFRK